MSSNTSHSNKSNNTILNYMKPIKQTKKLEEIEEPTTIVVDKTQTNKKTYHIFIDGSYFVFYRLFALINWWKLSHKEESHENLHLNNEFMDKFKELFIRNIIELPKKLKIGTPLRMKRKTNENITYKFYVGIDCNRKTIWRQKYIDGYKDGRTNYIDKENNPGEFFKYVYDNNLFSIALKDITILQYDSLEADDCIGLYVKQLSPTINKDTDNIYIITADQDYMQLFTCNDEDTDYIHIYDLKYKSLRKKMIFDTGSKELLYKIIIGDKSDNICSIKKKCGKKTAQKLVHNEDELNKLLENDSQIKTIYERNRLLIDFDMIPYELKEGFYDMYKL